MSRLGEGEERDAGPPPLLVDELATCLRRFVEGRADEPTLRRARRLLAGLGGIGARPGMVGGSPPERQARAPGVRDAGTEWPSGRAG